MPTDNDERGKVGRSSRKQGPTKARKLRRATMPLLVKIANAEDEVTSDGFDVFRYRKPLGRRGLILVPRDKAIAKDVVALLAAKNADLAI